MYVVMSNNAENEFLYPVVKGALQTLVSLETSNVPPTNLSQLVVFVALLQGSREVEGGAIDTERVLKMVPYARSTVGRILGEFIESGLFEEIIDKRDRRRRILRQTQMGTDRSIEIASLFLEPITESFGADLLMELKGRWEEHKHSKSNSGGSSSTV